MTIKSFFTPEEQKKMISLRGDGCSIKTISVNMHRSRQNVKLFLSNPEQYKKLMKSSTTKSASVSAPETPKKAAPKKKPSKGSGKYSKSPGGNGSSNGTQKITVRDLAEFNKVSVEHRCVIKFLTKLGEQAKSIYFRLKKVYDPLHPELPAVRYWATQFRKGRQTILNDPQTVKKLSQSKSKPITTAKSKSKTSVKTIKKSKSKSSKPAKSHAKKVVQNGGSVEPKVEEARKNEAASASKFTIKLPGMDRLSKTLS